MDNENNKNRIIGLGKYSFKKTYYPELQKNLNELNVYKSIFDQSNDCILTFEPETGQVLYINQAAKKLLEIESNSALFTIEEILSKEYWDKVKSIINSSIEEDSKFKFSFELYKSTEIIYTDNSISIINQQTKQLGSIIISDISSSIAIQKQIILEKEKAVDINKKTQAILNAIPDLMFVFNNEGIIVDYHVHKDAELLAQPEAFINKAINEVLPPSVAEITQRNIELVLKTKQTQQYNYILKINDSLQSYDSRIVWIDERTCLAMVRNITERVKMIKELEMAKEKAEESDRLKTAFLANMSHEIRTPMNGIMGFAQLLGNYTMENDVLQNYISIINHSCKDLLQLINDILDISKIEAGQVVIRKNSFNPVEVIENLHSIYELKTQTLKKDISIKCSLPNNATIQLKSDELRIKQVLINLLDNALKFTNQGEIAFGYGINAGYFEFFVSDTGCGINAKERDIIFDRFRQSIEAHEKNTSGTGLGLSISKGLVQLLGGDLWVESEVNKGSTFKFKIPIVN